MKREPSISPATIRFKEAIRFPFPSDQVYRVLIWGHSDQTGGHELACLIFQAFAEVTGRLADIGVITSSPDFVTDFFAAQAIISFTSRNLLIASPLLTLVKKDTGVVDSKETSRFVVNFPAYLNENAVVPRRSADPQSTDDLIDTLCSALKKHCHPNTLFISCGEPIAVEVAYRLNKKCVIVTDHLLTATIRWVLQNGGRWNSEVAARLTQFENFDRHADRAFLSPPEFAGRDYDAYLAFGSVKTQSLGGLFYDPLDSNRLENNPSYTGLRRKLAERELVICFGGGGTLWLSIYRNLTEQWPGARPRPRFALLLPTLTDGRRARDPSSKKWLWTLLLPDQDGVSLEDPGKMMYWYAACTLLVGRGGLAAQQIFATAMGNAEKKPQMLFIEEEGHPQIEHERISLFNLGFVETRKLDTFRADPLGTIAEVLSSSSAKNEVASLLPVRYGRQVMKALAACVDKLYGPFLADP